MCGETRVRVGFGPLLQGPQNPPSSSIYTALRALFRLWVLSRLKVRHSCIKHKKGKENVIADALSHCYTMLSQLDFKLFGLETIKDQYLHDADFKDVLQNCKEGRTWKKFIVNDGFVFRANKLCIPASSLRLLLLQEAHGGGLMDTLA